MQLMNDIKDPQATLDYIFDWKDWLGSDTISSYIITPDAGITLLDSSEDGKEVVVWLSGGEAAERYNIRCQITTLGGRVDERTMTVRVDHR